MQAVEIIEADLHETENQQAVVRLLDAYSMDPMANGKPLSKAVRRALIPGLMAHPTTLIFLAFQQASAIGIAVCFFGFSTFAARRLINVHDLAVLAPYRGQSVGRQLLNTVEQKARQTGCCKLTLEVQEKNVIAMRLYESIGFRQLKYAKDAGGALYLAKTL
jgi:ribosomal protein S18 acetylase RimI-like enzyme